MGIRPTPQKLGELARESAIQAHERFQAEGSRGLAALALAVSQLAYAVTLMQQQIDEKNGQPDRK